MKVFVLPTWHPTKLRPLWANWILPHIELLRENGLDAYVLQLGLDDEPIPEQTDPWNQPPRFLADNHTYIPVPRATRRCENSRFFYGVFLKKYAERSRTLFKMAAERWGKPDILHAHVSLPAGYVAALLGHKNSIPVIVQEHYTGFESDARFWWRKGCFVREMGRNIQGFYAVSPGYARRIERTGLLNVTGVLPNPIDTYLFTPTQFQKENDVYQIVTAGNMNQRKGADLLFQALHQLMPELNWQLTLFGDISQRDAYSRWLDDPQFSSRLSLPGKVLQEELRKTYSQSDLYVVSSRIETANVSMLQAMACGVPVVTTSCGAPETLIDESVGVAVKPNDPQAFAEGILEVARNAQRYDRKALRRFVVERYSKPVVANMVVNAYEKAIAIAHGK